MCLRACVHTFVCVCVCVCVLGGWPTAFVDLLIRIVYAHIEAVICRLRTNSGRTYRKHLCKSSHKHVRVYAIVCVCVCMCVKTICLSVCLSLGVSVGLYLSIYISTFLSIYLCDCLHTQRYTHIYTHTYRVIYIPASNQWHGFVRRYCNRYNR